MDTLCERLNLECVHVHDEIVSLFLEPERCACVVAFGPDTMDTALSLAKSNAVPLHLHITDKQFRDIFIQNKTKIHLNLPNVVRSISIDKGMLCSGYSLYRDAVLRDLHMDVAYVVFERVMFERVMFEREAREYHFSHPLTQRTHLQ